MDSFDGKEPAKTVVDTLYVEPGVYSFVRMRLEKTTLTIQINDGHIYQYEILGYDEGDDAKATWSSPGKLMTFRIQVVSDEIENLIQITNDFGEPVLRIQVANRIDSIAAVPSLPSSAPMRLCQWHVDYARQTQMLDQPHLGDSKFDLSSQLRSRLASMRRLDPAESDPLAHFSET